MSTQWTVTNECPECPESPPGAQSPDPNPLPDIETGFNPPNTYISTKEKCAECTAGLVNTELASYESGVTLLDGEEHLIESLWCDFTGIGDADRTILEDDIDFRVEGSLDGNTWFEFGLGGYAPLNPESVTVTPYTPIAVRSLRARHYLNPHAIIAGVVFSVKNEYVQADVQAVCKTATATSTDSQLAADQKAEDDAIAAAQAELICKPRYSATIEALAKCPYGTLGSEVRRSATAQSWASLSEAERVAGLEAQSLADAALVCTGSNNQQLIELPASSCWGSSCYSKAVPFPSIYYYSGYKTIVKVTATLKRFARPANANSFVILLVSPQGTTVILWNDQDSCTWGENYPDITFDQAALTDIFSHLVNPFVTGSYKPSNKSTQPALTMPTGVPALPYSFSMHAFNGEEAHGAWQLLVCPRYNVPGRIEGGWTLQIT